MADMVADPAAVARVFEGMAEAARGVSASINRMGDVIRQLRIDGTEEDGMAVSLSRSSPPLPATYVDVMHHIHRVGHIRPMEAGLILYAHQGSRPSRERYASSDGSELLRRMAKRGLVHWVSRGRWEAGAPAQPIRPRRSEQRP